MHDSEYILDTNNLEQQTLLELIRSTSDCIFLTGKAGTGKSTLLRYIHEHSKKTHVLLASTGIAALNIGGQTIHSFFKLPLRPLPPEDPDLQRNKIFKSFRYSSEHRKLIRSLEMIIIDEISMVRADVIDAIDKILRAYTARPYQPFGGIQMLFVGDLYQLEPVVRAEDRQILDVYYRSHYFFAARVFNSVEYDRCYLLGIELRKVYRQEEAQFVEILDRVRAGQMTSHDLELLNNRVVSNYQPEKENLVITLASRRDRVAAINEECLQQIEGRTYRIGGVVDGDFPKANLPTEEELILKEGAQVMLLTNDRDKRWANGTIAVIEHIDLEEEKITVRLEDGSLHAVERNVWENNRYTYDEEDGEIITETLGMFTQYPLRLAWAITIHKSQGLTFERVVIDFTDRIFASGQTYVALSRCRSLEGMTLRAPIHMRDIIARPEIARYYEQMNNAELLGDAFARAEANQHYLQANTEWKQGRYSDAIVSFRTALEGNNQLSNPLYLRLLCQRLGRVEQMAQELRTLRRELEDGRKRLRALSEEHVQMGNECLIEAHDPEAALRCYAKAIDYDIRSLEARLGQARAYRMQKDRNKQLSALREAEALSPLHATVLYELGKYYSSYAMYEKSIEPLARLIAQDTAHIPAIELIIKSYERLGDEERAEQFERLLIQAKRRNAGK